LSRNTGLYAAILVGAGVAWGATQPLSKVAVSTGHQPLGLIFWQLVIAVVLLALYNTARRRPLPLHRGALVTYLVIALTGTLLPNSMSYLAVVHLPAGIMSIAIATVPMVAFPIALALGSDRFSWARLAGLGLGLAGVALIALPSSSLPEPGMVGWLGIALLPSLLYAIEGNYVARFGTAGCGPVQALLGASLVGAILALPLALASGQWIDPRQDIGQAELALITSSAIHAGAYVAYVWLIGRAGAVFAAQVAYVVTGAGVLWAMVLLGESYSGWVWLALGAMMAGLALVQPRGAELAIAVPAPTPQDGTDARPTGAVETS